LLTPIGAVWAGTSVFPDWFHKDAQDFWTNEFSLFFDADEGVDIDALWIDMNEASNFCPWPCLDPDQFSIDNDMPPAPPPVRDPPRPLPGFPPVLQPSTKRSLQQRAHGDKLGLPGRDLINPPYMIENAAGSLSNKTMDTDLVHANGVTQYDAHNLYGSCKFPVPILREVTLL
jgi:alpha-glucosidase